MLLHGKLQKAVVAIIYLLRQEIAGTAEVGSNIEIGVNDFESIKKFVLSEGIEMVVVGPEDPLVNGIYDFFQEDEELQNISLIGPSKEGARLEG